MQLISFANGVITAPESDVMLSGSLQIAHVEKAQREFGHLKMNLTTPEVQGRALHPKVPVSVTFKVSRVDCWGGQRASCDKGTKDHF